MTNLPSQSSGAAPSGEECALVREALEYGVILATRQGDTHGFERAVAQASVFRPRCVIALPAGRALPPPPPFSPAASPPTCLCRRSCGRTTKRLGRRKRLRRRR
jgi:hypothetical protein